MINVEIRDLRILHLIILSIISTPLLFITIQDFFYVEKEIYLMTNNPDQSAIEAGLEYLVFLVLVTFGSISGIISLIDLIIEKNRLSFINLILAILTILTSFYYK